jgi:peptide/nickel transport system ATP-binding protein
VTGPGTAHLRPDETTVLSVEHLVVEHGPKHARAQAVSDVSFDLGPGETLGLVGESGCGKSSLARALLQLPPPVSGSVVLDGTDLVGLTGRARREAQSDVQIILQDPKSSLNPRRRVRDLVVEGLAMRGVPASDRRDVAAAALADVGLDIDVIGGRRAHELSGGQCQRVCIARALAMRPQVVICDEPVSALDVSVQAQTINLLRDLKARLSLSLLFIAHDLAVVRNVSDRVAVMHLGKLCETGPPDDVYESPAHPYTRALLDAIPTPDPRVPLPDAELAGEPSSPINPPTGCRFRLRCPRASATCADVEPAMREVASGQYVACHHPLVDDLSLSSPGASPATISGPRAET